VIRLTIPPLRERIDDIPILVDFFCKRYGREFGRESVRCGAEALDHLRRHHWPGNVRELENTIQRAIALCAGSLIEADDLLLVASAACAEVQSATASNQGLPAGVTTMRDMERELIRKTLDETGGNRTRAAKVLGISLRTLRNKLNEFGLQDRPAKFAQSRVPA